MTIADLLARLAVASLAVSVAALLVLALRLPLRRFLGARLAYWLWLLVPAAMLGAISPVPAALDQAIGQVFHPAAALGRVVEQTTIVIFEPASPAAASAAAKPLDASPLLYAWLAGAAGFAAFLVLGQRRAIERFGLLGRDAAGFVRAASRESGPALIGLVRPRIILPSDFEQRFRPQEQQLILAHERTHLRHGDLWINGVAALIQVLNWFNPLVHLAAFLLRVDQELACDAAVVKRFPGERRTYAEALLKSQQACIPTPLGCHWPGRSPQLLQERLTMLARHQPNRTRLLLGGTLLAGLCLGAGAAAWAAAAATSPTPPSVSAPPAATPAQVSRPLPATGAPAPAQPEATTFTTACLSNSCGGPSRASGPANAAAIAAGIKAGDANAVIAAGGSAEDVLAAWASADALVGRTPPIPPGAPNLADRRVPGSAEFFTAPDGAVGVRSQLEGGGSMVMIRGDSLALGGGGRTLNGIELPELAAGQQPRRVTVDLSAQGGQTTRMTAVEATGGAVDAAQGGGGTVVMVRSIRTPDAE